MSSVPSILLALALVFGAVLMWRARPRVVAAAEHASFPRHAAPSRLQFFFGLSLLAHCVLIGWSLIGFGGCRHERPLGVLGGTGNKIAKGVPEGVLDGTGNGKPVQVVKVQMEHKTPAEVERKRHALSEVKRQYSHAGALDILRNSVHGPITMSRASQVEDALDSVATPDEAAGTGPAALGLPSGTGTGDTAAGSPWGSKVGGKLWLYRVKYDCDGWNANPKALPILLQEVASALKVKVAGQQETIALSDLPNHRNEYMPAMLFMTGTGRIETSHTDRENLRDYLMGGGMLVADSSGGDFELQFVEFMSRVLPGLKARNIELDHEVFRGSSKIRMPYKMPSGCPIYREHGSPRAKGIFAPDGRLMVFISPGDMGDAWATVELGKKRDAVELAFHMGTNLVAYSLMTVHDTRKGGK